MRKIRLPGRRYLAARVDAAVRWRVDEVTDDLRQRLGAVESRADWTANEVVRLAPHVAALDARLEDLRITLMDERLSSGANDLEPARSVLDEVRREHALIRERLGAIGIYEDRLRAIEERSTTA